MRIVDTTENLFELYEVLCKQKIPTKQYKSYINSFLELKARKRVIPLTGSFELTPLCNLDCKMCYVHLDINQFDQQKLLPVQAWESIIQEAYEAGMRRASITGGECLTYAGFDDIYLYLYKLGIVPTILTNGILVDQKRLSFFKQYPPRAIQITLYGSSDDSYEAVTGHRVFNTVFKNMKNIRDAGIPLHITITPSLYMSGDIHQILEKAHSIGVPYFINSCLKPPRENTGRIAKDITTEQYIELYLYYNKLNNRTTVPVDFDSLPEQNHIGVNRKGLRCGAGRSAFAVMHDGNMCPCFSLRSITSKPLEIGFIAAWDKINSFAANYHTPEECNTCVYYHSCLSCAAIHENAPSVGHCDPRICERTKRFVAAGIIPYPTNDEE